jgi:hypothetical protein
VAKRRRFLIIAVLLTTLNVVVDLSCGWQIRTTWPGDGWNAGLVLLLAALGATSLASVWAQVVSAQVAPSGVKNTGRGRTAALLSAQARGQADV